IDAVLQLGPIRFGIFYGGVVAEIGEQAPGIVVGESAVAYGDVIGIVDAHTGPVGVLEGQPVHHHIIGIGNQEGVLVHAAAASRNDHSRTVGLECDRIGSIAALADNDATFLIEAWGDQQGIAGGELICAVLDGAPGMSAGAVAAVRTARRNIVGVSLSHDWSGKAEHGQQDQKHEPTV
ncbi:MAG TPA: hypothetical protein VKF38_13005, partial [Anaerolineaceae bacterium]|nr:hypothetical protein [Anaerolineaceae bacterium]